MLELGAKHLSWKDPTYLKYTETETCGDGQLMPANGRIRREVPQLRAFLQNGVFLRGLNQTKWELQDIKESRDFPSQRLILPLFSMLLSMADSNITTR